MVLKNPTLVEKLILQTTFTHSTPHLEFVLQNIADFLDRNLPRELIIRNFMAWDYSGHFLAQQQKIAAMIEAMLNYPYKQPPYAFKNQFIACCQHDLRNEIKKIMQPTLVMAAAEDMLVSPRMSQELVEEIPNAMLEIIPHSGHVIQIDQPENYNRIVIDFLQGKGGKS